VPKARLNQGASNRSTPSGLETPTDFVGLRNFITTPTIGGSKIDAATFAADSAFTGAFAANTALRPSNLTVFLGDSITIRNDTSTGLNNGECFATYAGLFSAQRIRKIHNAGVSGNNSAQMLARFDTDVTPYAPSTVHLLAGTNDTGVIQLSQYQTNMIAIIAKIRSIGAVPIIGTIPPNSTGTPTNRKQQIIQFNAWLRLYCTRHNISIVDYYGLLADPANGNWAAAYPSADGTHPDTAAMVGMGQLLATTISALTPSVGIPLCADDVDENNMLLKGCFGGYSGSSLPTGYTDNAGTTGVVLTYTTDSAVAGQMVTLTSIAGVLRELTTGWGIGATTVSSSAIAGATTITIAAIDPTRGILFLGSGATFEVCRVASVTGTGPYVATLVHAAAYAHPAGEACVVNAMPGDTIASSGVYTSNGGTAFTAKLVFTTPTTNQQPVSAIPGVVTRGVWYTEHVIPAGTTTMFFRPSVAAGSGVTSFGQLGLYNVSRLSSLA
jgi:lysophospholipase L1-like esterase